MENEFAVGLGLGAILEKYRHYLNLLATSQLSTPLRTRVSPSDIVQETCLQAHQQFRQFRGATEGELLGWLRQILASRIFDMGQKHLQATKRDVRREQSLQAMRRRLDATSVRLENYLADRQPSPSSLACHNEGARLLAEQVSSLAADHREVLVLRNIEGMSFAEIADRMNRSSAAVRMLWLRAVEELRQRLKTKGLV